MEFEQLIIKFIWIIKKVMKSQCIPETYGQGCEKHMSDQTQNKILTYRNKEWGPAWCNDRQTHRWSTAKSMQLLLCSVHMWELSSHRVYQWRKLWSSICAASPLNAKKCEK